MKINKKRKVTTLIVTLTLLFVLALTLGITGAFFRARREATGTIKFDSGIVIMYNGFGKKDAEIIGQWERESTVSFKIFETTTGSALPGDKISVSKPNQIAAGEKSVPFYARFKLNYEFYNEAGEIVALAPEKLITTSSKFVNTTNWQLSTYDNYYYYVDTTNRTKLIPFTENGTDYNFVSIFDDNAQFIIEGENFIAEQGGFVFGDETITRVVVTMELDALQAAADPEVDGPLWRVTTTESDIYTAKLSEFEWEAIDGNNDGVITADSEDYLVLKKYIGTHKEYRIASHYDIYKYKTDTSETNYKEYEPEEDTSSVSGLSAAFGASALAAMPSIDEIDIRNLPVKQLGTKSNDGSSTEPFDKNAKNIIIPGTVDTVGDDAFIDGEIANIDVETEDSEGNITRDTVYSQSEKDVEDTGKNKNAATNEWLGKVVIGDRAFSGTKIKSVVLPDGIQFEINKNAFDSGVSFVYQGKTYSSLEDLAKENSDAIIINSSSWFVDSMTYVKDNEVIGGAGVGQSFARINNIFSYNDEYGTWYLTHIKDGISFTMMTFEQVRSGAYIVAFTPSTIKDYYDEIVIPSSVSYNGATLPVYGFLTDKTITDGGTVYNKQNIKWDNDVNGDGNADSGLYLGGENPKILKVGKLIANCTSLHSLGNMFIEITELVINGDFPDNNIVGGYVRREGDESNWDMNIAGYYSTSKLEKVTMSNLTRLPARSFYNVQLKSACSNLKSVYAPKLQFIYSEAFNHCTSLCKFNSDTDGMFDLTNVVYIGDAESVLEVDIWNKTIPCGGFAQTACKEVKFGSNVYIGAGAFWGCANLEKISFANISATAMSAEISAENYVATSAYAKGAGVKFMNSTTERIWIEDTNNNGIEDEGDKFLEAIYYDDVNNYVITSYDCEIYIDGVKVTSISAANQLKDFVVKSLDGDNIEYLAYYAVSVGEWNYIDNISSNEYVVKNLPINQPYCFVIRCGGSGNLITFPDGTTKKISTFKFDKEVDLESKTVTIYKDQNGNIYYPDTAYHVNSKLVLTKESSPIYTVTYKTSLDNGEECFNDLKTTFDSSGFGINYVSQYVSAYNNYLLRLPTFGIKNGNKYIAGWQDQAGNKYLFNNEKDGAIFLTISEYVHLKNIEEDIVLCPIWEIGPTISYATDENNLSVDGFDNFTYITYNSIIMPSGGLWYDKTSSTMFYVDSSNEYKICLTTFNSNYTFIRCLTNNPDYKTTDTVLTNVDSLKGYTGLVYNINNIKLDTGYSEAVDSPTSQMNVSLMYGNNAFDLRLPNSPETNDGWSFIGWTKGDKIYAAGDKVELKLGYNPTTYTATYAKFVFSYGSENPTNFTNNEMIEFFCNQMRGLDLVSVNKMTNNGYIFAGWVINGKLYDQFDGERAVSFATVSSIANSEALTISPKFIKVDTGYVSSGETPTSTQYYSVEEKFVFTQNTPYSTLIELNASLVPANNYVFVGWIDNNGNLIHSFNGSILGSSNNKYLQISTDTSIIEHFTAKWVRIKFDVDFDGSELISRYATSSDITLDSYMTGANDEKLINVARLALSSIAVDSDYYFMGWSYNGATYILKNDSGEIEESGMGNYFIVTKDMTDVIISARIAKVTFDTGYTAETDSPTNDQTVSISINVDQNGWYYTLPEITVNEGYQFKGWRRATETIADAIPATRKIYDAADTKWIAVYKSTVSDPTGTFTVGENGNTFNGSIVTIPAETAAEGKITKWTLEEVYADGSTRTLNLKAGDKYVVGKIASLTVSTTEVDKVSITINYTGGSTTIDAYVGYSIAYAKEVVEEQIGYAVAITGFANASGSAIAEITDTDAITALSVDAINMSYTDSTSTEFKLFKDWLDRIIEKTNAMLEQDKRVKYGLYDDQGLYEVTGVGSEGPTWGAKKNLSIDYLQSLAQMMGATGALSFDIKNNIIIGYIDGSAALTIKLANIKGVGYVVEYYEASLNGMTMYEIYTAIPKDDSYNADLVNMIRVDLATFKALATADKTITVTITDALNPEDGSVLKEGSENTFANLTEAQMFVDGARAVDTLGQTCGILSVAYLTSTYPYSEEPYTISVSENTYNVNLTNYSAYGFAIVFTLVEENGQLYLSSITIPGNILLASN